MNSESLNAEARCATSELCQWVEEQPQLAADNVTWNRSLNTFGALQSPATNV